jgi:hypothetical protein
MKKIRFIVVLFISFIVFIGAKSTIVSNGKSSTLIVKGYVFKGEEKVDKAFVKLYQNNKVVQMTYTKKGGKFQFILFSGMLYMVEINKPGFISERIQVSTEEETEFSGKYLYEFKVDLINESKFKGVDVSNLDFPTALIKYNIEEGEYMHDVAYSNFVKIEMKKLKEEAKKLKNK